MALLERAGWVGGGQKGAWGRDPGARLRLDGAVLEWAWQCCGAEEHGEVLSQVCVHSSQNSWLEGQGGTGRSDPGAGIEFGCFHCSDLCPSNRSVQNCFLETTDGGGKAECFQGSGAGEGAAQCVHPRAVRIWGGDTPPPLLPICGYSGCRRPWGAVHPHAQIPAWERVLLQLLHPG